MSHEPERGIGGHDVEELAGDDEGDVGDGLSLVAGILNDELLVLLVLFRSSFS